MKILQALHITALIICILNPLDAQNDAAQRLYQEGIFQMEAMGDFSAAIELFEKLVSEHPENKPLASRALLMAGRCHEKLGQEEAEKAYNRILEEYSDQREIVNEARTRLMALPQLARLAEHTGMLTRKVWQGLDGCYRVNPSPNLKYIAFRERFSGNLAILEPETGKTRRLTNKEYGLYWGERANFPVFSPDGKVIAYTWYDKDLVCGLRLFDMESSKIRVLLEDEDFLRLQAFEWSPDGKAIVLLIKTVDKELMLCLYRIEEDTLTQLKSFDEHFSPVKIAFSPNGRYIAYDHYGSSNRNYRSIFTIDLEYNKVYELVTHPSENFVCGWSPDGSQLIFISNRTGVNAIFSIPIEDGRVGGAVAMLKNDVSMDITPIKLTESGSLYYGIDLGGRDVYTASFNPDDPEPFGSPVRISQWYQGANRIAAWSNDGKTIAYVAGRRQRQKISSNAVIMHNPETGREREIILDVGKIGDYISWSPDDKFIVVRGNECLSYFILSSSTGEIIDTIKGGDFVSPLVWSSDQKNIYFFRNLITEGRFDLIAYNTETGREKVLFQSSSINEVQDSKWIEYHIILLSDQNLIVFAKISFNEKTTQLFILDLSNNGTEHQNLLTSQRRIHYHSSYKGDQFYFIKTNWPEGEYRQHDHELWLFDLSSKETNKIASIPEDFRSLTLHPDGKTALFNIGPRMNPCEIWVIDNLLPARLNK